MKRESIFYILSFLLIFATGAQADTKPKEVKVGYFEGGAYYLHKVITSEIKAELEQFSGDSINIIFEPYAYRSAEWKRDICRSYGRDFARMNDIDIVFAVGPWVVEDLLDAGYKGAIIGIHQFDPVSQGLIDTDGRPIADNLTVTYHPGKIESDIEMIQKLFSPRRIGFLYFPSADESDKIKSRLALAADRYGASIISSDTRTPDGNYSFFKSLGNIRDEIDVLYLPPLWGVKLDQLQQFFNETTMGRVPTFTSEGFLLLEKGATASNCIRPDLPLARFTAHKIIRIINGERPADMPTTLDEAPAICLNLEAARKSNVVFDRNHINNAKTIQAVPSDNIPQYSFSDAISQALRENVSILRKGAIYQEALAAAGSAYSAYYPQIKLNLSAAATGNETEAAIYNNVLNREFGTDIILDQKLLSYPVIKAIHIAEKKLQIEKAGLEQARLDLKHTVAVAYLSVIENEEKVETIEKKIDRLRQYWEMSLANSRLGFNDTLDILVIQERLVAAKMLLHDARAELNISRVVLNVLLNRPGDNLVILDKSNFAPEIMVGMARKFDDYTSDQNRKKKFEEFLVNTGIANSTEMQITSLSIGIQRDLISQHRKRYLPDITLRAKYSYNNEFKPEFGNDDDTWTIGGYLSLPILSGTSWKHRGNEAQAALNELLYEKDMIRFERMQAIMTATEKLTSLVATLPMSYFTKNLALDNLEPAYSRFKDGKLTAVELLTLEEHASEMEFNLLRRKIEFFSTYSKMLFEVGVGYLIYNSAEEAEFFTKLEKFLE